jgi:hypothetical protein
MFGKKKKTAQISCTVSILIMNALSAASAPPQPPADCCCG